MKKKDLIVIIFVIINIIIFSGCSESNEKPIEIVADASPVITSAEYYTGETMTSPATSEIIVLENGLTLDQINRLMSNDITSIIDELGSNYYHFENNSAYESYYYYDIGINILCDRRETENKSRIYAIECDTDKIIFLGTRSNMGFEEIQECLGSKDFIEVSGSLPNALSYELRYEINGVKIQFISFYQNGVGYTLRIPKDFDDNAGLKRISISQLENVFSMDRLSLLAAYQGASYNELTNSFSCEGLTFCFRNDTLNIIEIDDSYDVEGIRYGYNFEMIMSKLGTKDIVENKAYVEDSVEDTYYSIKYDYKNFYIEFISSGLKESPWLIDISRLID